MTDQHQPNDAITEDPPADEADAPAVSEAAQTEALAPSASGPKPAVQGSAKSAAKDPAKPAVKGPESPDELPYIDDPVSKWWIAIIAAVFALIFAGAILLGSGGLFDGLFDSGDTTSSPEATLAASMGPAATAAPSVSPSATVVPSATETPGSEATAEATAKPQPTEMPTLAPTAEPAGSIAPDASEVPVDSPGS